MEAKKSRRLPAIAKYINEHPELGLRAEIEKGYYRSDYKPAGFRYIVRTGKERVGNRLKVWLAATSELVFDHNSAETYRTNQDVELWLAAWERGDRRRWSRSGHPVEPMTSTPKKKAGRR